MLRLINEKSSEEEVLDDGMNDEENVEDAKKTPIFEEFGPDHP